jgi:hypothetical protein
MEKVNGHTAGDWEKGISNFGGGGHITNNRGIGFTLHGGTRRLVKIELCRYLDELESNTNDLRERNAELVECLKDLMETDTDTAEYEAVLDKVEQLIEKNGG